MGSQIAKAGRRRRFAGLIIAVVLVAGCAGAGATPTPSAPATQAPSATSPSATPTSSSSPLPSPTAGELPSPSPSPTPTPDPDAPRAVKILARVDAGLKDSCWTGPEAQMAQAGGLLWFVCGREIVGFDPMTNVVKRRLTDLIPYGQFAGNAFLSTSGADRIAVDRYDLFTGKVTRSYDGALLDGVSGGYVWLEMGSQALGTGPEQILKVDPSTGKIVATTRWPAVDYDGVGCGMLWGHRVLSESGMEFLAVSPKTGATVRKWTNIFVSPSAGYPPIQIVGNGVIETTDGCWLRVEGSPPVLVELTAKGEGRISRSVDGLGIKLIDGELWASEYGYVARLDPTGQPMMERKYVIGTAGWTSDSNEISFAAFFGAAGTYWTVDADTGALLRLDIPAQ